jgi:hypothetical protein
MQKMEANSTKTVSVSSGISALLHLSTPFTFSDN